MTVTVTRHDRKITKLGNYDQGTIETYHIAKIGKKRDVYHPAILHRAVGSQHRTR